MFFLVIEYYLMISELLKLGIFPRTFFYSVNYVNYTYVGQEICMSTTESILYSSIITILVSQYERHTN